MPIMATGFVTKYLVTKYLVKLKTLGTTVLWNIKSPSSSLVLW